MLVNSTTSIMTWPPPRTSAAVRARRMSQEAHSARQACTGVDDLHTLDQEPQTEPDFSDEAHGEPGVVDRGVGRQQQGLKEPDQNSDSVKQQKDAQEPGKESGLVDQIAEREQPRAEEQLGRDPASLVDVDG